MVIRKRILSCIAFFSFKDKICLRLKILPATYKKDYPLFSVENKWGIPTLTKDTFRCLYWSVKTWIRQVEELSNNDLNYLYVVISMLLLSKKKLSE